MKVLGIDLGAPGAWAVLVPGGQLGSVLTWGRLDKGLNLARLRAIIIEVIDANRIDLVATEKPFTGRWDPRPRVGMGQREKQSVVRTICQERRIQFEDYPPWEIKKTVAGSARATKAQVATAVWRWIRFDPKDEHVSDAAAIAIVAMSRLPSMAH